MVITPFITGKGPPYISCIAIITLYLLHPLKFSENYHLFSWVNWLLVEASGVFVSNLDLVTCIRASLNPKAQVLRGARKSYLLGCMELSEAYISIGIHIWDIGGRSDQGRFQRLAQCLYKVVVKNDPNIVLPNVVGFFDSW